MRWTPIAGLILATGGLSHSATAEAEAEDGAEDREATSPHLASTVVFTTDYRFRGISNSNGPAIQGSLDWTWGGVYLGVWGSNTAFSDAHVELDYYAGYRYTTSGFTLDVSGLYYHYPGEHEREVDELDPFTGQEADYLELHAGIEYKLELPASPTIGVQYYWSPDFFGEDSDGHYVQGDVGLGVVPAGSSTRIGLYATAGYQSVEGDRSSGALGGYRYAWWQAGASVTVKGVRLDLSRVEVARSAALEAFYAPMTLPDGRVADFRKLITHTILFAVSRTF